MGKVPEYGSPEWHAERRSGIGASDIAAVAGLSRYRGPFDVYADKVGLAAPLVDTPQMYWGRALEPVVAAEWAKRHETRIRHRTKLFRHPQYPWAIAHLDYDLPGTDEVLEIKTAGHYAAHEYGEDGSDQVPTEYLFQTQWELFVTGKQTAHLAVLIGGHSYHDYVIPRDAGLIENLRTIGEDFWLNHVAVQVPPEMDGSAAASRFLAERYPKDSGEEVPVDPGDPIVPAVERLLAIREQVKGLTAEDDLLVNQIKERMGPAAVLRGPRFRVSWKQTKDGTSTDWHEVALEAGLEVPGFRDIVAAHTVVKPGVRQFRATLLDE